MPRAKRVTTETSANANATAPASTFAKSVFAALRNTRVMLGFFPSNAKFSISFDETKINGEVTRDNLGGLDAHLTGASIDTIMSAYKVASIIVCKDKTGVTFHPEHVTVDGVDILSSKELARHAKFAYISDYIGSLGDSVDVEGLEYTVAGKVGMHNSMAMEVDKARRLRYLPECYVGNPAYQAVVSSIDSFASMDEVKRYSTAVRELLATDLREGAEKERGLRVLTAIVTVG